jgi:hypothetical protein
LIVLWPGDPPQASSQVFILKVVKVLYFDTLLRVLISEDLPPALKAKMPAWPPPNREIVMRRYHMILIASK